MYMYVTVGFVDLDYMNADCLQVSPLPLDRSTDGYLKGKPSIKASIPCCQVSAFTKCPDVCTKKS